MKIVNPKLKVRNQLYLLVASYFDSAKLTGPTGLWYTNAELNMNRIRLRMFSLTELLSSGRKKNTLYFTYYFELNSKIGIAPNPRKELLRKSFMYTNLLCCVGVKAGEVIFVAYSLVKEG